MSRYIGTWHEKLNRNGYNYGFEIFRNDEEKEAGIYIIGFDASHLSNGIYFYRMEASCFSQIRKFLLLK